MLLGEASVAEVWPKYAWLDEPSSNDDLMAGCLGVIVGVDEAWVAHCLAVDEGSCRQAVVHEAWELSESDFGNDLVQISALGNAVVTYEPNGWRGVCEDLVIALSQRGRYAAYFWNVNAVMRFVYADTGHVRRDFDPLFYDGDRELALPQEFDLPFPSGDADSLTPGRASLALIERLTARGNGCSTRLIRPTASTRRRVDRRTEWQPPGHSPPAFVQHIPEPWPRRMTTFACANVTGFPRAAQRSASRRVSLAAAGRPRSEGRSLSSCNPQAHRPAAPGPSR